MGSVLPTLESSAFLPGHKGPRGVLLLLLKRDRGLTAKHLAARLGISLNAVRHHLKELAAEGLVRHEREHRGVGAPVFAYGLTPAGEALFPRRYEEPLTALLDYLVEREGRPAAVSMLEAYFGGLARRLMVELEGTAPAERLARVARVLSEEGYMAEGRATAANATLVEHNCAIPVVAERFPEICAAEARFLSEVLGAEVDRTEHILSGCGTCEYHVRFKSAQETS